MATQEYLLISKAPTNDTFQTLSETRIANAAYQNASGCIEFYVWRAHTTALMGRQPQIKMIHINYIYNNFSFYATYFYTFDTTLLLPCNSLGKSVHSLHRP